MKKVVIIWIGFCLIAFTVHAQVGIETLNPNASLDVRASNQGTPINTDGVLIPKIDEFPAVPPTAAQDGMTVFVTGNGTVAKGYYYWDSSTSNWINFQNVGRIDYLADGKSDNDGSQDGSSLFIGIDSGSNDDGTDNSNVAVGNKTLEANSLGEGNVAFGADALLNNFEGNYNTGIGVETLVNIESSNGYYATYNVTSGFQSSYSVGHFSNFNFTSGAFSNSLSPTSEYNVVNGAFALGDFVLGGSAGNSGGSNVANGAFSLHSGFNGPSWNVASGYGTLENLEEGNRNVAIGAFAFNRMLIDDTFYEIPYDRGSWANIGIGPYALYLTDTDYNGSGIIAVGIGAYALYSAYPDDPIGLSRANIGIGAYSNYSNTTGNSNVVMGYESNYNNLDGGYNVAIGSNALYGQTSGDFNVGIGYMCGGFNGSQSGCVFLGYGAGYNEDRDNKLYITNTITPRGSALIYGDFDSEYVALIAEVNVMGGITTGGILDLYVANVALRVNGSEALWYNGTYFSYGFGGSANYFSDNVGIGITNPSVQLDVIGSIEYTGTITDVSDSRLKENLIPIENAVEKLQKVHGYTYSMIDDVNKRREYGFIAQDVQKVFPEMVSIVDKENGHLGVSYIQFIPVIIEAVKEQQEYLAEMENENIRQQLDLRDLSNNYKTLLQRVEALEEKNSL